MPGPFIYPQIPFDTSTIPFPAGPMGTNIFDSHTTVCGAGVWTQICAGIGFPTKFVSLLVASTGATTVSLGLGEAGLEIEILDALVTANTVAFVVNAPLIIAANRRISVKPTAATNCELHLFY